MATGTERFAGADVLQTVSNWLEWLDRRAWPLSVRPGRKDPLHCDSRL
jgi:hypothetical protein